MKSPKYLPIPKKPKLLMVRRVAGDSMMPALRPNRIIFARRSKNIEPGDIAVLYHDGLEKIKRVKYIKDDKLFVVGDNLARSLDSRNFGWVDKSSMLAKVMWPKP